METTGHPLYLTVCIQQRQDRRRTGNQRGLPYSVFFFFSPTLSFIILLSSRSTLSAVISTLCVQLPSFLFKEKNSQCCWCRVLNTIPYWSLHCVHVAVLARSEGSFGHREAEGWGRILPIYMFALKVVLMCVQGVSLHVWMAHLRNKVLENQAPGSLGTLGTWGCGDQGYSLQTLLIILTPLCEKFYQWK